MDHIRGTADYERSNDTSQHPGNSRKPPPIGRAARTKEDSMNADLYVRILLTIIAGSLMVLMFHSVSLMPGARAATPTTCTGEMKATSAGPMQASIGGSYKIEVTCN
jgi:hypothetical protein